MTTMVGRLKTRADRSEKIIAPMEVVLLLVETQAAYNDSAALGLAAVAVIAALVAIEAMKDQAHENAAVDVAVVADAAACVRC